MNFDVRNRRTGEVQFTARIDATGDTPESVKLGRAVVWGHESGANLTGANLIGANLYGANLTWANLDRADLTGANLTDADLYRVSGFNRWIKCLDIETYPICYTANVMQIGCENHTLDEWREFDDARIMRMDGNAALKFWRKYKDWIFRKIELCPAEPTGAE